MEWDDLRYVLALVREGTLSAAAASLGATHTTVGRRLRALEARLGVRLFDRTPDGYVPTAAGHDMAAVAEKMEEDVLLLEGRVLGRDARLAGKLRVTTLDMLFRHHHAAFSSFTERYPSIELTVGTSDVEVSLTRREADVALRMTRTPPPYLVGRKVGRVEFAPYASRALVARVGVRAPLSAYPWLHWDERLNMRWLDVWLAKNAPGARIALRMDAGTGSLRDAVAAGLGVHFLATFEGDGDPSLKRLAPVDPSFGRDLWLLTLAELKNAPRVRAFMDHVGAYFASPRGTSAPAPPARRTARKAARKSTRK